MQFWKNKKVFITGHTGFKGSWLSMWLTKLGAQVVGYALNPPTSPSLYQLCRVEELLVKSVIADIRDLDCLKKEMKCFKPDIIIHMAAQPLVKESYIDPVNTYSTNVMGTVHLFEAIREAIPGVRAVINVTTDKCYENQEWMWGYRENEALGGYDPYSSSKACSEMITTAYRNSYFHSANYAEHGVAIATVRAGNVIGGGDWAQNRLIPDCIQALWAGELIKVRNPHSIRPWQHVLEPLNGYITLARKLYESGTAYEGAWNMGPEDHDAHTVEWIVRSICNKWAGSQGYCIESDDVHHEATYLKLDSSKAKLKLGWHPQWNLEQSLDKIIEWTKWHQEGGDMQKISLSQIDAYQVSVGVTP